MKRAMSEALTSKTSINIKTDAAVKKATVKKATLNKVDKNSFNTVMTKPVVEFTESQKANYALINDKISIAINDVSQNFYDIACAIYYVDRNNLFAIDGYKGIGDYAESKYSFSKSKTSQFINVVEVFGQKADGYIVDEYKRVIADEWISYGWSKLSIMAYLSGENLKKITPSMSFKDISAIWDAQKKQEKLEKDGIDEKRLSDNSSDTSGNTDSSNDSDNEFDGTTKITMIRSFTDLDSLVGAFKCKTDSDRNMIETLQNAINKNLVITIDVRSH